MKALEGKELKNDMNEQWGKQHVTVRVPSLYIFRSDFMSAYNACSHNHSEYTPNITGCFTWLNKSCKVHVEMATCYTVLPSAGTSVQMFLKYGWLCVV